MRNKWKSRSKFRSLGLRAMEDKLGMQKGALRQESSLINKKSTTGKSGKTEHRFQRTNRNQCSESKMTKTATTVHTGFPKPHRAVKKGITKDQNIHF